jgi:hypothetical protein
VSSFQHHFLVVQRSDLSGLCDKLQEFSLFGREIMPCTAISLLQSSLKNMFCLKQVLHLGWWCLFFTISTRLLLKFSCDSPFWVWGDHLWFFYLQTVRSVRVTGKKKILLLGALNDSCHAALMSMRRLTIPLIVGSSLSYGNIFLLHFALIFLLYSVISGLFMKIGGTF